MKRMLISLVAAFLLPLFAAAQQPVVERHSCWDIPVVTQGEVYRPFPCIASQADSGLMLIDMARGYLGTPYHFGGRTPKGFDCAGFALFLYHKFGHNLPGWSGAQAKLGTEVSDTRNLQPGDLVFFGGRHKSKVVGHTGIVIETNDSTGVFRFIHASTGAGVIISKSTEPYYKQRYITARRIFL
ncbi:MAG: C40 family peptidase [Bacteroidales bacterium]|nr:C40 family peptidase [Bacteroidales bacterium]